MKRFMELIGLGVGIGWILIIILTLVTLIKEAWTSTNYEELYYKQMYELQLQNMQG